MSSYSILVANAGTSAVNGEYLPSPTLDANGNPYWSFSSGSRAFAIYDETTSGHWVIGPTLNGGPATVVYSANGTATAGPDTAASWVAAFSPYTWSGALPAPTVSRIAAPSDQAGDGAGSRRFFSTGVLNAQVTLEGVEKTLTFATVQDATISCRFQEKSAYAAAGVSAFPQATAYHDGQWSVKINAGEFSADALQMLAAMRAGESGAGYVAEVIAGGAIAPPEEFSGTFTAFTPDGEQLVWQFRRLLSKGIALPFQLNDFLYTGMELTAIGDDSGGIVDLLIAA